MPAMTPTQIDEFLATDVLCRLACVDPTGHPYVVPCWFTYADGGFYVVPRARSAWAAYLQAGPRVSLCIDAEDGRRVLVQGRVQVVEEPNVGGRWVEIAREMVLRYRGAEGLAYLEKTMQEPRWLIFIAADEMRSSTGGWAKRYKHSEW
ncbi:MAG: pyridoxamine 5'-phosphate oxidase family protein [Chloroflexi bacterium]|nr:pyridoxamine 5'-phosphate oxidase family protein [Chloroflexota bacterium]